MMISDGNGMQADSIAISATRPMYPAFEITAITKAASAAMIFSIMKRVSEVLEILGKGVARKVYAVGSLRHFDADGVGIRGRRVGRTQHRVLGKQLAIEFGYQEIAPILIVA